MDLQLSGRIAIVTGASKGIGLATVEALVEEGARVVAASRSRTPALEALGGEVLHVPADLMDPSAPAQIVARATEAFGGLDVLVNNVGGAAPGVTLPRGSFLDATEADWQATLDLNLLSAVRMCRAAIPALLERGGGAIVNVSSGNGRRPYPGNVDYAAAKAALTNLGKALSEEFAPQGVRVNTVSPGPVRTPWWTDENGVGDVIAAQAGADRDTVLTAVVPEMMQLTTGRMAEPREVADVIALLASPRSGSTTGAEVVVDSGFAKQL